MPDLRLDVRFVKSPCASRPTAEALVNMRRHVEAVEAVVAELGEAVLGQCEGVWLDENGEAEVQWSAVVFDAGVLEAAV